MKMTQDHYQELSKKINEIIDESNVDLQNLLDNGYSAMYYRWKLYHMVCDKDNFQFERILYMYLTDDQIDTALKKITGTK